MSKKFALMAMMGLIASLPPDPATQISSCKIETEKVEEQPSRQKIKKMKGKGARKNRGRNRR